MSSYSYSQLQAAYKCNRYYKLLYIDKLDPGGQESADLVFGSSFHHALEEYLLHGNDPIEAFHIYWDTEKDKVNYGRYNKLHLEEVAAILLDRFVRLHAKKITVTSMEQRLYGTYGVGTNTVKLEGTPDVVGLYKDIPSIIDFKTAAYRYDKDLITVNPQMYLYAHLAQQNGFKVEQVVYQVFIKSKEPSIQVLTAPIKYDEMNKMLDNVMIQCKELDKKKESGEWSYNPASCIQGQRKCEFFDHCWGNKKGSDDNE